MRFEGVFAIPCTPFTAGDEVDIPSLRRQIRFCHDCGVHGLVAPVNASEFTSLTDAERRLVVEVTAEENAGRAPFVAGVSAVSAAAAVDLARHAAANGADALIAMPPYVKKASSEEIFTYYARIAAAVDLPLIIQDFIPPIGTPMSVELLCRLLREIPQVQFLKEEAIQAVHVMTAVHERAGTALEGMMGGQGGRYLFTEVDRGARGTMPACQVADVHVDLWEELARGEQAAARARFNRLLPLLNLEALYSVALYKEVLRRRGVIETAFCRGAPAALDAHDLRELDQILVDVEPLFRVRY